MLWLRHQAGCPCQSHAWPEPLRSEQVGPAPPTSPAIQGNPVPTCEPIVWCPILGRMIPGHTQGSYLSAVPHSNIRGRSDRSENPGTEGLGAAFKLHLHQHWTQRKHNLTTPTHCLLYAPENWLSSQLSVQHAPSYCSLSSSPPHLQQPSEMMVSLKPHPMQ